MKSKTNSYRHILLNFVAAVLLTAPAFGQLQQQNPRPHAEQREPDVRLKTEIVNLVVTVTDRRNVAVSGLKPEHFEVYEDNVLRLVEYFRCEDEPLSIGVIFDLSASMEKKIQRAREAVNSFTQASHQDDEFFLIGFNQQCRLLADFTDVDSIPAQLAVGKAQGKTALYDAVYLGVEKVRTGRYAKRALLIVSDGEDNASRYTSRELYRRLREDNILIYCLGYGLWRGEASDFGRFTLEDLARITGGRAFFPNSEAELEESVAAIALELRRQYSLAYAVLATSENAKWRKIKVQVNRPAGMAKLRVRTREGYYAGSVNDR